MNWPVAKFLLTELPPFSMRAVCCLIAIVLAFALARLRGERLSVPSGQWRRLVLFATLNYGAFIILTTLALTRLRASEAVTITYTLPIWAAVIAWPVLGERLTAVAILALVLGLSGVALLVGVDASAVSVAKLPGVAMALGAAVLFGLGTVLCKKAPLALPPVTGVAWQVALSFVPVIVLAALTEQPDWSAVTPLGWAGVVFSATLPTTLAYLAWFRALRLVPAGMAATGVLLSPVVGVIGSAVLLGDPLGARQVIALAITLTGVGLAACRPGSPRRRA